jgi:hypothetical protein
MDCDYGPDDFQEQTSSRQSPPPIPRVVHVTKRWEGTSPDWGHQRFEQEAVFHFGWTEPNIPANAPTVPTNSPEMCAVIAEIQERVLQNEAKTGALESRKEQMKIFAAYILEWVSNVARGITETHKMMSQEHGWIEQRMAGIEELVVEPRGGGIWKVWWTICHKSRVK